MTVINNIDSQRFTFNGVEYYKNFTPKVIGNKIEIINTYDSNIRLTNFPTLFSEFEVNGNTYANVEDLQTALLPVLYTIGTHIPAIHKTYENITALFSDQSSQTEGYFYKILDATGFGDITQGRATVSYKGTTNGDESDYNIEWRDDIAELKTSLIEKRDSNGNITVYVPSTNTNASRGAKFLEVLNGATSGDYITVYQGTYEAYIPIQANLDNVTIEFKLGATVVNTNVRHLISNDAPYDINLKIVGEGSFLNMSTSGLSNNVINITDGTILEMSAYSISCKNGYIVKTSAEQGGNGNIGVNSKYFNSTSGSLALVNDENSIVELFGRRATVNSTSLTALAGVINCNITDVTSQNQSLISLGVDGTVNVYGSFLDAKNGNRISKNSFNSDQLNFYNCTGSSTNVNPVQGNYTGTIFINSDFYTESNATFEEKTDKTPITKGDYVNDKAYLSGRIGTASGNITGAQVIKFDEFWSDNGSVSYDAVTGRFTFTKSGTYQLSFNSITIDVNNSIAIGLNTDTPTISNNIGYNFERVDTSSIALNSIYDIQAGDYIVFAIVTGGIRNDGVAKGSDFFINKIG